MRRAQGLFGHIATFAALRRAAFRAARGKRRSASAARFLDRLEPECLRLERELLEDTWRPGPASTFAICDPKPRTITAVPFADRVVHHALIGALEPVFERRMIAHSYACRRDKGMHAALARVQRLVRRFRFALRMDVRSFFPSLHHDVVFDSIERLVKDRRVLALVRRILAGPDDGPGGALGLPIGSLTSQWFANLVLDRLDHHACEVLRQGGYTRYMDDFVCFDDDRDRLRDTRQALGAFLEQELRLVAKPTATRLMPTGCGVPWLGFSVFPGTTRLRPENAKRYARRLRELRWQCARERIDPTRYRRAVASLLAHLRHGDTLELRRAWFRGLRATAEELD
ncbi:MAG: reverse transcriptase/maturase family protein [Planctomycetota bacterium]